MGTKTHWDKNTLLKKLKKDKKNYVMYEPPPRYFYWGQKPTWDKNTLNQQKHIKFVLNRSNNKKNVKSYHCFKDSYPCFQTMNLILKSNLTMFFYTIKYNPRQTEIH